MLKRFLLIVSVFAILNFAACGGSKEEKAADADTDKAAAVESEPKQEAAASDEGSDDAEESEEAAPKKSDESTGSADWIAPMTMLEAINAANEALGDKYPGAEVFKVDMKYTKKSGKFTVQYKIDDMRAVKVDVDFSGKTKVNDKKGAFFNVPKGSVKNQDALPKKESKPRKKKAAADDE